MIVSYQTGMEFLQDNQEYLQTNPYLSTFFTLDAPLLKQADKINYALRCEQGDKRLLAFVAARARWQTARVPCQI